MKTNDPSLDMLEVQFLFQLKKDLALKSSQETVRVVASVLQALRQTLSLQNAYILLNKLPDFLKVVYASNWKHQEKKIDVKHLDEFVNLVIEVDKKNKRNIIKDEVQALSIVIVTLKKLYKLVDLENFKGLSNAIRQELREIPIEVAA